MNKHEDGTVFCLRGLKRSALGEAFNLSVIHFYNEMVEKGFRLYLPYRKKTNKQSHNPFADRKPEIELQNEGERKITKAKCM